MDTDGMTRHVTPVCERPDFDGLAAAAIEPSSRVLEINCGTGELSASIAARTGAATQGVDLSAQNIAAARALAAASPDVDLEFTVGSAAALPFADATFTHVVSRRLRCRVDARDRVLPEIARVLEPQGIVALEADDDHLAALTRHGFVVYGDNAEFRSTFRVAQKVADRLAWIYQPDPRFTLESKYDAWAGLYDADLRDSYTESPRRVAALLSHCLPDRDVRLLDVGAGTGMVGESLSHIGYHDVTALDQSRGMLDRARAKNVYRRLVRGALADIPTTFAGQTFEAITAVGVFTFGHAHPGDVAALDPVLEPGGWLVVAVRVDYLADNRALTDALDRMGYEIVAQDSYDVFGDEPMLALACRKPLR